MEPDGGCPDENTILEHVEQLLAPERAGQLEAHLDRCPACRHLVAQLTRIFHGAALPATALQPPANADGAAVPEPTETEVVAEIPGRYLHRSEMARGGHGRVLVVHDTIMGREVAMKLLAPAAVPGGSPSEQLRRSAELTLRFLREVRIAGQLAHPTVIDVYELGRRTDGTYYFTMQYVRGRTLAEALARADGLRGRLQLLGHLADVCNGIAYAHSRGVLHRDLKPTNVMIGDFGETVILDWGLAGRRSAGQQPGPTPLPADEAGAVDAQPRTLDGTFLGTPAYMSPEQASGRVERIDERSDIWGLGALLHELLTGHPPFEGTSSLEILEKVLTSPVPPVRSICPDAPPELAAVAEKALRRDKTQRYATARELGSDITAYMTGNRVSAHRYRARDLLRHFVARHRLALGAATAIFVTTLAALVAVSLSYRAEQRALRLSRYHLAQAHGDRARRLLGEQQLLAAGIFAAASLTNNPSQPGSLVHDATFGRRFPEAETLRLRAASVAYRARYRILTRLERPFAVGVPIRGVALGPDERLFTGDNAGRLRTWSIRSGALERDVAAHRGEVLDLALSPDGRTLASAGWDGAIRLWDARSGRALARLSGHTSRVNALAFSADGKLLASAGQDRTARLWDARSGAAVAVLADHPGDVLALAFSPDGVQIATGALDHAIRLFAVPGGGLERTLTGHESLVLDLAFSSDGSRLASASLDRTTRVWDTAGAGPPLTLVRQQETPFCVAFSPDGRLLASGTINGTVRLWDPRSGRHLVALAAHADRVYRVAFSADGRRLVSAGGDGAARVWAVATPSRPAALVVHEGPVQSIRFSPDGRWIATAIARRVQLWDARSGQPLRSIDAHDAEVTRIAFSPDGQRVASASLDGTVRVWETQSGQRQLVLAGHGRGATGVAFAPDGALLASSSVDRKIRLWSARDGKLLATLDSHESGVWDVAFSPDGVLLAAASYDRTASIWRVDNRVLLHRLTGHRDWVASVSFSPDGRLLATTGRDAAVLVWDPRTGRRLGRVSGHRQWVRDADFTADGTRLVTVGDDRTVRVWSTRSWEPLLLLDASSEVGALDAAPRGSLIAYGDGKSVTLLPLEGLPLRGSPQQLLSRLQRAAGMALEGFRLVPVTR
jgi:WD40 repeat protein